MSSQVFPGKFSSLEKISKFVKTEAENAALDDKSIYEVQLAVDEACSNIIEHAYNGEAGVFLMKKLMDAVEFEFLEGNGTILTLVKNK
jgi:serine/threonine-protein kinase RsbW